MCKKLLFISLLSCLLVSTKAQLGYHFGITSAANSTWIINQNNFGTLAGFSDPIVRQSELAYKYKFGYQFGFTNSIYFSKRFAFMSELIFNKAGQNYEDNMQEQSTRINVKRFIDLSYLQFPVSLKYTSKKGKRAKFYFHIGPQIGFLLSSSERVYIDNVLKNDNSGVAPKDKFTKIDFGMQLGTGVNIYASKHFYFGLGFNSYLGFLDMNGKDIKGLDWFSKNDINYQRSKNFRGGLVLSLNYTFLPNK